MKQRNQSFNKTKKRALEVLQDKTWMNVPAFAGEVGIRPVRRAYSYLAHLEKLGLVAREPNGQGKLHYQITDRGLERLQWLRSQSTTLPTTEELIASVIAEIVDGSLPRSTKITTK